jgi:hypothetical protein
MTLPIATRKTAFIAGMSLSVLVSLLGILKLRGASPYDADSPEVFPFILIYFFLTVLVFVIDVRCFAPKELKTRIPMVYFPTNMEGVLFLFTVWGRMLVWFLGAVVGGGLLALLGYILK